MRVAVIGVGHLGKQHARIYREIQGAELTHVVDFLPDRAAEIASAYGAKAVTNFREVYGNVDAASLAVPTTDHARIGAELLENGIDVLVEKPIAASASDAQQLIDTAARHGRVLQVGHVERFNPVVRAASE